MKECATKKKHDRRGWLMRDADGRATKEKHDRRGRRMRDAARRRGRQPGQPGRSTAGEAGGCLMRRGGGAGNQGEARQERPADVVRRRGQQPGRWRSTAGEASEMEMDGATVRGKLAEVRVN